jgi:twitching motility protein PilU
MDIRILLKQMVEREASDLYLTVDSPPTVRVEGINYALPAPALNAADVEELTNSLMTERQRAVFEQDLEMNLGISSSKMGRFRINIFKQRGSVGAVIRLVKSNVPTIDGLGLPEIIKPIAMTKRGLVLVTGATGSGKSTTLAAMIDYRNTNSTGHIVTIEDPIEFMHEHKRCLVSQREVGFDTHSYEAALKNTLRQAPDVILLGEVRDRETMEAAITFAETGHLCLATLHSNNANQAIERIMNFFPGERHAEIYLQLSLNLRAIISQRLIIGQDDKRVAALEILLDTPYVKDLIKKGQTDIIKEAMEKSTQEGGQTFDQHIFQLYVGGKISEREALENADSANNMRIQISNHLMRQKTGETRAADKDSGLSTGGLRIQGQNRLRRPA